jgi:hypothetical protein
MRYESSPTTTQVNLDGVMLIGFRLSRGISDMGEHMARYCYSSTKSHDVRGHSRISIRPDTASSVAAWCSVRLWRDAESQNGTWPGEMAEMLGKALEVNERQGWLLIGITADSCRD